jgi:sugar lactone lactonase YvrE
MHDHWVKTMTPDGRVENVVEVKARPSGLGWLPDGSLLIVSMSDRRLLRYDGGKLAEHADLSQLAAFDCNDMVVDANGRAYVGSFGFDLHNRAEFRAAGLICVEADGSARSVAEEIGFPNGTVITPDSRTLVVAESFARKLTAFTIAPNGDLGERRVWAELEGGISPDGICLDEAGGIWVASPPTQECVRVVEGGEVTHRVEVDRGAFACMLGRGPSLYILTSSSSNPSKCREQRSAQIEVAAAPHPGAGWP